MKILQFVLISIVVFSCSENESNVHEWIRSHNENTLRGATLSVEERGNKSNDFVLVNNMKAYQTTTSELIQMLTSSTKEEVVRSVEKHLDTIDIDGRKIDKYFTASSNSSLDEIKAQLALVEKETFQSYTKNLGVEDVVFESLDIYFLPDDILVERNSNVSGRLVFAATAAFINDDIKMILNGKELEMSENGAIVNIPYSEIRGKGFTMDAKFDAVPFDLEYSKKIELKPVD